MQLGYPFGYPLRLTCHFLQPGGEVENDETPGDPGVS